MCALRVNLKLLDFMKNRKRSFQMMSFSTSRFYATKEGNVVIGDISKDLFAPKNRELIPKKYFTIHANKEWNVSQNTLRHLRWMMQKDNLGQDMFILGRPGPNRRKVAMQYLELTQREIEYVALSRDTTESDLKQRREIENSTAKYFDQSAVRAAVEGRVLVLEGIEKAERNVLPVLNNLLENREMHLEDGRFLIPAERYDKLMKEHSKEELDKWRLVRVDENFRVIALGLPVPKYSGQPLDPPLRSRFQARDVANVGYGESLSTLKALAPDVESSKLEALTSAAYAVISPEVQQIALPDFPLDNLVTAGKLLRTTPQISLISILNRLYPYTSFLTKDLMKNVESIYNNLNIDPGFQSNHKLNKVVRTDTGACKVELSCGGDKMQFDVPCGELPVSDKLSGGFVKTEYQSGMLAELMLSHSVADFCIIGPKGCGKSQLISQLAAQLGYSIEPVVLFQDMTARDLLQQRTTLHNGDTVWRNSALVEAALNGRLAILDGLHRIHASTLSVLHRLVHDRELQLHDGTRLLRHDRFDELIEGEGFTREELESKGIRRVHPAFRIVALAEPPQLTQGQHWLTPEMLSLFLYHEMRNLTKEEEIFIIKSLYGGISKPLESIIELADKLRTSEDPTLKNLSSSLSTRQLLRIASRMTSYPTDTAYETIQRTFLAKFLPNLARIALETTCNNHGIENPNRFGKARESVIKAPEIKIQNGVLSIGQTTAEVYKTQALTKVPDILFYNVPQHVKLLEWLLQDFNLGNHLLLVGNQGVGKNKIADRLLQLMNRPREYIQLHRDTTVQSLTVQPTVVDGVVVYEDSPLVKAVKYGHVLVVDEADKAPTHVTCILKTLVENGEMILSDGRRIIPVDRPMEKENDKLIQIHKDFRMIVLANRPGFPFLGNDFFGALGDLFSCHAVDNPSRESEMELLRKYGPDVPDDVMRKLVNAFAVLREMADRGQVTYPYSSRELVNIVKHLQKYPKEDLASVIGNVFDFDRYSKENADTLLEVLHSSGLPTKGVLEGRSEESMKPLQMTVNRKSGLDVKSPKHGQEDPDNQPHVGGNTWAGGTGGRDTAGLGGKGGPYRLDKGHDVHQLSDEEKEDIPEHVKEAARKMNRQAFEERLKEIKMSEFDANLYGQFLNAVQPQIGALRGVLSELQAKQKERQWSRHQTTGELDDSKIIEGLTGERNIYRRRVDQEPPPGSPPELHKRLRLVVDVSGSMYRFNSYDGRLERSMEAVVLLMEAVRGFESRLRYDIFGHSGETHNLELISAFNPPENEKERLQIIRTMHAHAQFCWSGDNTLPATQHAIQTLAKEECDEAIVVVLSDANLRRYGIKPESLGNLLVSEPKVQAHAIFIGSLGDEANMLLRRLPVGHAHVCMEVTNLPQILQQIFAASVLH